MSDKKHEIRMDEQPYYDEISRRWDNEFDTQAGRYYRQRKAEMLKKVLPINHGVVVDVGCATGYFTAFFHSLGFTSIGVDFSEKMVERSHQKYPRESYPRIDFRVSPAETMSSIIPEPVDIVFMSGLLDRRNCDVVLSECSKILKARGYIFIISGNGYMPLWKTYDRFHYDAPSRNFIIEDLTAVLDQHGYVVEEYRFFDFIPYQTPACFISLMRVLEAFVEKFVPHLSLSMIIRARGK